MTGSISWNVVALPNIQENRASEPLGRISIYVRVDAGSWAINVASNGEVMNSNLHNRFCLTHFPQLAAKTATQQSLPIIPPIEKKAPRYQEAYNCLGRYIILDIIYLKIPQWSIHPIQQIHSARHEIPFSNFLPTSNSFDCTIIYPKQKISKRPTCERSLFLLCLEFK